MVNCCAGSALCLLYNQKEAPEDDSEDFETEPLTQVITGIDVDTTADAKTGGAAGRSFDEDARDALGRERHEASETSVAITPGDACKC